MRLLRYARNDRDSVIARRPQADEAIWSLLAGVLLILAATTTHASDRSIRCGNYLIHSGGGKDSSSMYEVLKKCGEPVAKQGNTWIYEQGSMLRMLTFNPQGRLQRIESRRK